MSDYPSSFAIFATFACPTNVSQAGASLSLTSPIIIPRRNGMRSFITLFALILFTAVFSQDALAKIWIVSNIPGQAADYDTFSAAHTAASPGDTIYVIGSSISYGSITVSKRLHIVGPGYYLSENADNQALPSSATFDNISFDAGSESSTITGMYVTTGMTINVDSVTVRRNNLGWISMYSEVGSNDANNAVIVQNYLRNYINTTNSNYHAFNIYIANNYIPQGIGILANSTITNNVVSGQGTTFNGISGSTISNNIVETSNISGNLFLNTQSNNVTNNIIAGADPSDASNNNGTNNQFNVTFSSQFVGLTGNTTDSQWQLASAVAAVGAGVDGVDCGMYGGAAPYVLSGLPDVPSVYFLSAATAGSATSGLPVHIKARSNK